MKAVATLVTHWATYSSEQRKSPRVSTGGTRRVSRSSMPMEALGGALASVLAKVWTDLLSASSKESGTLCFQCLDRIDWNRRALVEVEASFDGRRVASVDVRSVAVPRGTATTWPLYPSELDPVDFDLFLHLTGMCQPTGMLTGTLVLRSASLAEPMIVSDIGLRVSMP